MDGGMFIRNVAEKLSDFKNIEMVYHHSRKSIPMPSAIVLSQIIDDIRSVLFPGYFGPDVIEGNVEYQIGAALDRIYGRLTKQIRRGFCFDCPEKASRDCNYCEDRSVSAARLLIEKLPEIRSILASDAMSAYEGDPAARSAGEAIFCYPSLKTLTSHRIAHELYKMEIPLIPRMISELAHSESGIDIHPGAQIGERFFIDHGTGVVIGETSVIGNNVRLYQGVTLGFKSFPLDENGNPVKGTVRHPRVEDDVIIYANATILGPITIGRGSQIGGNCWITESVPPESRIKAPKYEV